MGRRYAVLEHIPSVWIWYSQLKHRCSIIWIKYHYKYLINSNQMRAHQLLTTTGHCWHFIWSGSIPQWWLVHFKFLFCASPCVRSSLAWLRLISDSCGVMRSQRKTAAIYIKKDSCRGHLQAVDDHWTAPDSACTVEPKLLLFLTLTMKKKTKKNRL